MNRVILVLVVAVQLAINFECIQSAHHSKLSRGFRNIICRIKHRKVILNHKGKAIGCSKTCPGDHEERYTLRWGHHCKPVECAKGCLACDRVDRCTKCQINHAIFETPHGKTVCQEKCPNKYKKMKMQGIVKCVMNSVVTGKPTKEAPTIPIVTTKEILPDGCADRNCINCIKGYFKYSLSNGRGNQCIRNCPEGYKAHNSICIACSDRRCASCSSSIESCERCFSGYVMRLDKFNNTVDCSRTCPRKHAIKVVNNATLCILEPEQECTVANCKKCIRSNLRVFHSGCEKCLKGFKLFRGPFKDHCYTTCPEGYFASVRPGTNIATCAKCEVPFCSRCTDENTCKECIGPMVLDPSARCTTCQPKHTYNFDTKTCIPDEPQEKTEKNEVLFELINR